MPDLPQPTTPHPGRMYDYIIGGTHNFEVDRVAADRFVALVPSIPLAAPRNRELLAVAARRWRAAGLDRILDLGSGVPTAGHLDEHLPDARILFTDRDETTVQERAGGSWGRAPDTSTSIWT